MISFLPFKTYLTPPEKSDLPGIHFFLNSEFENQLNLPSLNLGNKSNPVPPQSQN